MVRHSLGKIDCFGLSQKHPNFERNSDNFVIADVRPTLFIHDSSIVPSETARQFGPSHGQLLVVSDGVGERRSAPRASALVMDTVNSHLLETFGLPGVDIESNDQHLFERFGDALQECRQTMQLEVEAADRFGEMGAVLTAVYILWPVAYVMHIGNNRAYHYRQSTVTQITDDHTIANRLIDAGQLSHSRARNSKLRHVVWNLVGTQTDTIEPECKQCELTVGEALILCSDGMAAAVDSADIGRILGKTASAEEACRQLLAMAERRGLQDDATIVVARFADPEQARHLLAEESKLVQPPANQPHKPMPEKI